MQNSVLFNTSVTVNRALREWSCKNSNPSNITILNPATYELWHFEMDHVILFYGVYLLDVGGVCC